MSEQQVHFEIFARRAGGSFNLELAVEDRERAFEAASEMLEGGRFVAVKINKETLDTESGEYKTINILSKGEAEKPKSKLAVEDAGPPCISPSDLYSVHARDRIGRLLEAWLVRNRATPFELLHRPDLIEKLDASGTDLQHAIQKIAVPEAQARGVGVHEIIRGFQQLIQRSIDRVLADRRKGRFADFKKEAFAAACERLGDDAERQYLLGAGVAAFIAPANSWSEKVALLLDLAEMAPKEGKARGLALHVIEQPLGEILQSRVGMSDMLGADLDLGDNLAALTRLAAADAVKALARVDTNVARLMPPLTGPAERLAGWLTSASFEGVRGSLSKRVLSELNTTRRLRPADPRGEIEILRVLAMALTAGSGRLLPLDGVREAFIERSKMLVATDFVQSYLAEERSGIQEALDLVWLLENVTGGVNKRQAARWLLSTVTSLRFDTEMNAAGESPKARLNHLAELYRQLGRSGADTAGVDEVLQRIGDLGGRIEAENKFTAMLVRAQAPFAQKLGILLKMAAGETAPPGPASDRAKAEALRLVRAPEAREQLAGAPEIMEQVRALVQRPDRAA